MSTLKTVYITWPEGRYKALTLSYDDGKFADRRFVSLLNGSGLKGTFHINAGLLGSPERIPAGEVADLYKGHEISAHTWSHPTIERCPLDQVAVQVLEDRRALERLAGYPVSGLSYPNGSYSADIAALLPGLGIRYARTVETTGAFGLPKDSFRWASTCHHNQNLEAKAGEFLALRKSQYLYWFSVWGHAWEFDRDGNWELMERVCASLGDPAAEIWSATAIDAFDYLEAARSLRFTVDADRVYNPSGLDVWISAEGEILRIPAGAAASVGGAGKR